MSTKDIYVHVISLLAGNGKIFIPNWYSPAERKEAVPRLIARMMPGTKLDQDFYDVFCPGASICHLQGSSTFLHHQKQRTT